MEREQFIGVVARALGSTPDAVRASLVSRPTPGRVAELPTYRGRGLQPGVDLDDSAALLDIMSVGQLG